jgi:peptidoglycan/xylan/chitin deacetylase (PgdA/CDA1 family)
LRKYPETYKEIIQKGHAIGNHTFNHLNGWKTNTQTYIENAKLFETELSKIDTRKCNLFRPPYGKIKSSQANFLRKSGYKIIMWDVLSADYDQTISPEECLENVIKNISSGSIIVFHDSIKGFKNLEFVLPRTLEFIKNRGYSCEVLN